ncbi:MAG: tape measure protein [Azonexus sp.]
MGVPGSLVLRLLIEGSNAGAVRALNSTTAEATKTGASLSKLDMATGNFSQTRASLDSVSVQLNSLRSLSASVLSFAGVSLGAGELIRLADIFTQMNGRLRLATQYSGDFNQVQQMLRDSARATRSDLVATVNLYAQLSPALKGIGLSAGQSVGMVTTINQAIAMSGASSQAAEAALVQLGQGFSFGALRGENLNSILEQTPALAQAIADGLGISRGALREWGDEGKLTAEAVAGALKKVAAQVNDDFAKMPVTVGQAMTNLKNEVLVFVGATDQASGSTSTLANVINAVAQEFSDSGPAVTAFSEGLKIVTNGLDGIYRLLKIVGLGIAAYSAAAVAALSGDFSGARAIWAALGEDIDAVLQKPLLTEPKIINSAVNVAQKRQQLEEQLAVEVARLEKLKAFEAGTASDNVAAKEKANIDARIADQKRLVDAVRSAWQDSLKEIEKFAEAAQAKLVKATDYRAAGKTSAFNASISGLSEQDQLAAKSQRMSDLQSQGNYEAARARLAALEGDIKKYDAAAGAAEKRLKEALGLAEDIKDVSAIETISNELAKIQEAGAALDQKKSEEAKGRAESQAKLLNDLQAKLDALTKEARVIEVKAEVTDAESKVNGLKKQLEDLAKGVTVPVVVQQSGTPAVGGTEPTVGRAWGGQLPGYAPHDRADNVVYRGTPGEWVIQRPAVRYWGPEFIAAINAMRMPKFAFGGQIGGSSMLSKLAVPSIQNGALNSNELAGLTLDLAALGLGRHKVLAPLKTQREILQVFKEAAFRFGSK